MKTMKSLGLIAACVAPVMFGGCTRYYLENVHTAISIPDAAPIITDDRQRSDTRVSVGVIAGMRRQLAFNDGNHTPVDDSASGYYDLPYAGNNVEIEFPWIQGHLGVDYTLGKHLFLYLDGNFADVENRFCGAADIGLGFHHRFSYTAMQYFLFVNGYTIRSQATIDTRVADIFGDPDYVRYLDQLTYNLGVGGGLQFATLTRLALSPHVTWGFDAQLQKYYGFPVDSTGTAGNDGSKRYYMVLLTPDVGLFERMGNHQLTLTVRCGLPFLPFNKGSESMVLSGKLLPSAELAWTYCFRPRRHNESTLPGSRLDGGSR